MERETLQALGRHLFGDSEGSTFAVLDGASVPGLLSKLNDLEPDHECLYRGNLQPDMAEVAPYLVHMEPNRPFTEWVISQGWGKHWGIFVRSNTDLRMLRQHFRKYLIVHSEQGKPLLFRYYDPRVLRRYLPTCTPEELGIMFGPVTSYVLEGETPDAVVSFEFKTGSLVMKQESILRK